MGINHYVTSDRFLDHHLENYPAWTHDGINSDISRDQPNIYLILKL
ncbi:MAG: hypothetical protein AB3A66_25470 [Nodularia sp. CChRGM 3473]